MLRNQIKIIPGDFIGILVVKLVKRKHDKGLGLTVSGKA